ncbi:MAG: phosphodiester glycosidase family protein [Verrucomicrobiales bacterium]
MKRLSLLALYGALASPALALAQWNIVDETPAQSPDSPLVYERKAVTRHGESGLFSKKRIDLVWFDADAFTFRVVDNGQDAPRYPDLATAMRENGCLAGSNGGFFLQDNAPSGLMIAEGESTGRFGSGGLLSGVLLSSGNGNPYVLRRAEYGQNYQPTDLVQTGPFLVDQGSPVKGLSPRNARRRTFVLHDGGKNFALGHSDTFTLAELGQILADEAFSPSREIHRALNLDGGTSSGLYVDRGSRYPPVSIEPYKTVRNFVGIVPRNQAE